MMAKNVFGIAAASLLLASSAVAQPYGMGPGMMGGYGGGYGMGPGMMGGYGGGYGMGPGMMRGYAGGACSDIELTPEQSKQIADIREETSKAMWQLMGTMHQQGNQMHGMFGPGALDEGAARKAYENLA